MRRIPLSRRSHVIGFQPLATGTAEHESALERDFVTRTSFLHPAASVVSQPLTLKYSDGIRSRRYTPDFLVRYGVGHARLVEVKYRNDLRCNWQRYLPGFTAAKAWAREHGSVFRIATERHIRDGLLENAKRLLPLRHSEIDTEVGRRLVGVIRDQRSPTFGNVIERGSVDRAAAVATLWRLIAHGTVRVDLHSPITLHTALRLHEPAAPTA